MNYRNYSLMKTKKKQAKLQMLKKLEFVYIRISDLQTDSIYQGLLGENKNAIPNADIINGIRIDVKSIIDDLIDIL